MIPTFIRATTLIYILLLTFILLSLGFSYLNADYRELNNFLDSPDTCTVKPCFLGIVPTESDSATIEHLLRNSPFVMDVDFVDIQTKLHHVNWTWNGMQPSMITKAGYLRYRSDEKAAYLVLEPDLNLAEIWTALGEPDIVNEDSYYLRLSYFERGLIVRLIPHCRAVWYSDVWIDIDERIVRPTYETVSFYALVDKLCD